MAFVWREEKKLICDCFLFFHKFTLYFFFCPIKWFCSCLLFDIDFVCMCFFCTTWLSINSHCVLRNFVLLLFSFDLIWIFDLNYLSYWMQAIKTSCIPQQYYVRWNKKYTDFTAIIHKNFFFSLFPFTLNPSISNKNIFFSKTNTHFMHYDIFITIISTEWQFFFILNVFVVNDDLLFKLKFFIYSWYYYEFFFRFALLNSHHSKFSVTLYVFVCTSVYRRL